MVAMNLRRHSDPSTTQHHGHRSNNINNANHLNQLPLHSIVEQDESKMSKLSNQTNASIKSLNSMNSLQSISSLNSVNSSISNHSQNLIAMGASMGSSLPNMRPQPVTIDHASGVFYSHKAPKPSATENVHDVRNSEHIAKHSENQRNQEIHQKAANQVHPQNVRNPINQRNQAINPMAHSIDDLQSVDSIESRDSMQSLNSLKSLQSLIDRNERNEYQNQRELRDHQRDQRDRHREYQRECKMEELSISPISHHIGRDMISPEEHIEHIRMDLASKPYPEYLDGYSALSRDQKRFLNLIKEGDLNKVMFMANGSQHIQSDINFGDCQVLRECTISGRLEILKYLKKTFVHKLDLNAESGYAVRWATRKGLYGMVNWLLWEQTFQKTDISFFQYQAMEWAVIYKHKAIAKLLQKYYVEQKMEHKWNEVVDDKLEASALGLQFEISNLPSIYHEVIERVIGHPDADEFNEETVRVLSRYYDNGLDLKFENYLVWTVWICMALIRCYIFLL